MKRGLYTADHEAFREVVAEFVRREVVDKLEKWDEQRLIDRATWLAAGAQGIIGLSAPEEFGGAGQSDYRYRSVVLEELAKVHATSLASSFSLQDDIIIPYVAALGTEEQKDRYVRGMASGELIGAIAMTEPGTGSDLRGIRTSGRKVDGGWIVNGAKTFITSGYQCDFVITVVRTDPEATSRAFSLLIVPADSPGFSRGRKLDKVGLLAQDTAELFYEEVFVPDSAVLGELGGGLGQLAHHLPLERLSIAAHAIAVSDAVLKDTIDYTQQRVAFGQPIADFQNTRFQLAEMATELDVTRAYVDKAMLAQSDGELTATEAAKAKWWAAEVQNRIIDRCLQLHGGYGYMLEYPVARAFRDARIQKIFGGTNEIMKMIIGREIIGRR
ncbi:acyl-CoA dehydrogenase [Nakamurella sp. YIM 132087]|uniref:Acyl-CoA dehydrogenase n=1 Tax=Nakamurella alba TaxID=2665158 RepID=A0A7K1FPB0_9ACTN|nr:acyl-CoA dehydrogenase family protein [Nakamurella alba]MTD15985.1 acyl-CoA dehydrogenase [Nakamurella alba]